MTYREVQEMMSEETFGLRLKSGAFDVAMDIVEEPPATENHDNRFRWAAKVLRDPDSDLGAIKAAVLIQNLQFSKSVVLSASDSALKGAVESVVDVLAGV